MTILIIALIITSTILITIKLNKLERIQKRIYKQISEMR